MIKQISESQNTRIPSAVLNDVIMDAIAINPTPTDKGKRLKIFYATQVATKPPTFVIFVNEEELMHFLLRFLKIKSARPLSLKEHRFISIKENVNKAESGNDISRFFDKMKLKKSAPKKEVLVMEHLFKLLILLPCFYFSAGLKKANRDSKFFPIFTIFTGFTSPSMLFLALLGQFFSPIFNILLRNVADIKSWGIWLLLLLLLLFPVLG